MAVLAKTIYTPEEYLERERAAECKSEYVNGQIVAMSGGSTQHNRIQMNLSAKLTVRLRGKPCEAFGSDMRGQTNGTHYCYPNISVVCGKPLLEDNRNDTLLNPILIVEVLSPSTEDYDRGLKFKRYNRIESLREYVLVSQDAARVERRFLGGAGWESSVVEGKTATLRLESVGIEVPLTAIYARVEV